MPVRGALAWITWSSFGCMATRLLALSWHVLRATLHWKGSLDAFFGCPGHCKIFGMILLRLSPILTTSPICRMFYFCQVLSLRFLPLLIQTSTKAEWIPVEIFRERTLSAAGVAMRDDRFWSNSAKFVGENLDPCRTTVELQSGHVMCHAQSGWQHYRTLSQAASGSSSRTSQN